MNVSSSDECNKINVTIGSEQNTVAVQDIVDIWNQ
jgi:hypothetical protein